MLGSGAPNPRAGEKQQPPSMRSQAGAGSSGPKPLAGKVESSVGLAAVQIKLLRFSWLL